MQFYLMYTNDLKLTCTMYIGLLWFRPSRALTVGYACRGYQSTAAEPVHPPQLQADDISGKCVFPLII